MAWITIQQASELTKYNEEFLRRLCRSGAIKAKKATEREKSDWLIEQKSLEEYLKTHPGPR